mgnify:CR=1 FL=1
MSVSVFSFWMAMLCSTVLILLVHLLRKKPGFIRSFGVSTLLFLYFLCFFRMVVPLELPFVQVIGLEKGYAALFELARAGEVALQGFQLNLLELLFILWVGVAVCRFLYFVGRYLWEKRKLERFQHNRSPLAEQVFARVQEESSKHLQVRVFVCPDIPGPMGIGIRKKDILLPHRDYTEEELYYVLQHEYTHFVHRDLTVRFLTCVFVCVFWWNPAVYLLNRDVEQMLEIKCDLAVTDGRSKSEKIAYLTAILSALRDGGEEKNPAFPAGTHLLPRRMDNALLERFHMITRGENAKRASWHRLALLTVSVALLFASYLFVIQPKYDPPTDDYLSGVYEDLDVVEVSYLIAHDDGTYTVVISSGDSFLMTDESVIEIMLSQNFPIIKEDES